MYTEDDLNSAVQAGVMTDDTAIAFRAHVAAGRQTPVADEEYFRLITGFNDIFVVIACALLLVSVSWIGGSLQPWLGPLALAAVAWGLAEFFTRQRRMALPSIVLMLVFVGAVLSLVMGLTDSMALGSALAAVAAWLHWQRFKVPITVAAGAAALSALAVSAVLASPLQGKGLEILVAFFAGVAVFMWALRWDAQDRQRQTRKSDVAFWLHLLSAPLMVHPVFTVLGLLEGRSGWLAAAAAAGTLRGHHVGVFGHRPAGADGVGAGLCVVRIQCAVQRVWRRQPGLCHHGIDDWCGPVVAICVLACESRAGAASLAGQIAIAPGPSVDACADDGTLQKPHSASTLCGENSCCIAPESAR